MFGIFLVIFHADAGYLIHVMDRSGSAVTLRVKPSTKISQIKRSIQRVNGTPISVQRLLFNNGYLRDNDTLSHYNITDNDVLEFYLGQCGS